MNIFNEIRPEEIESGFQQPEPGYEGFILKPTDPYPGNFPKYEEPIQPKQIIEQVPEVSEGIIDAANLEGEIWDAFEQEQPLPEPIQEEEVVTTPPQEQQYDNEIETEIESVEDQNILDDPFAEIANQINQEPTATNNEETPSLSVDDELRKLLEEELARSAEKKAKKEATSNTDQLQSPNEQREKPEFVPVEETGAKVDFIDMMAIDPNEPRVDLTIEPNTKPVEVIPEKKSKARPKKEKVKTPKKEKEEKKPKGILFWIVSSAASLLIIATLSYFGFNYYLKTKLHSVPTDSSIVQKDTTKHQQKHQTEVPKAEAEVHRDTLQVIENKPVNEDIHQDIAHQQTPKIKIEEKTYSNTEIIDKPKKVITKPITKQEIPHRKANKQTDIITSVQTPVPIEAPQQTTEKHLYTIQVYATPSFEDAEFWRQKLTAMRINDVYISPQKVRDVIWYRVRFGKFSNRQQALDVAKQFGFSQTWVDRIQ